MYEIMVLGTLARGAMHGYRIAKVLDHIIGPFKQVQWGGLYPVLSRLEADGLIRADEGVDCEGTSRKVYAITDAGWQRLRELLLDTERHLGEYSSLFTHKVSLFSFLTPEERLYLSRHYAVYAQQNIDHLGRKRAEVQSDVSKRLTPEQIGDITMVMDHRMDFWRREREWAEELIRRAAAQAVPA